MLTRIVVALIALPIVLVPIYLGGIWSTTLFLCVALLGGFELFQMLEVGGYRPSRWIGLVWIVALILSFLPASPLPLSTPVSAGFIFILTYALFQKERVLESWLATAAGALYLGIMIGQFLALRLLHEGLWWLALAALIAWANDTMAYFTGVLVGRHKIWPRLSPKKTWEGTIGGWIAAAVVGGLVTHFSPLPVDFLGGIVIGGIGGVLALCGDLSISMVKRQVGVKDSGTLFPGHGGMLDRLDSLLFVIPFVYQAVLILQLTAVS